MQSYASVFRRISVRLHNLQGHISLISLAEGNARSAGLIAGAAFIRDSMYHATIDLLRDLHQRDLKDQILAGQSMVCIERRAGI